MARPSLSGAQKRQLQALGGDDRRRAKEIIDEFTALPDERGSRSQLLELAGRAFSLEKKALPGVWAAEHGTDRTCDTLIASVGMTKEPVILDVLCLRPRLAYLLHTDASEETAHQVASDPDVAPLGPEFRYRPFSEHDSHRNHQHIKEVLDEIAESEPGCRIWADPTGGTKMMVASLAVAAFYHRLPVVYLWCPPKQGVPIPFAGELLAIDNPYQDFADIDLDQVREMAQQGMYEAGLGLCKQLQSTVRDPVTLVRLQLIDRWLKVYAAWDRFEHSVPGLRPQLARELRQAAEDAGRMGWAGRLPSDWQDNLDFLEELEGRWRRDSSNMCDPCRLADLLAAADRRGAQGHYSDAVARLYRYLEMAVTLALSALGLTSTERPQWPALSAASGKGLDEIRREYAQLHPHRQELPKEHLGQLALVVLWRVLKGDAADGGFRMYLSNAQKPDSPMVARNRSELAHGTRPVTKKEFEQMRDFALVFASKALGAERKQLEEQARRARHVGVGAL